MTVSWRFDGNTELAKSHAGDAQQLLNQSRLAAGSRLYWATPYNVLNDGTEIRIVHSGGNEHVHIVAPLRLNEYPSKVVLVVDQMYFVYDHLNDLAQGYGWYNGNRYAVHSIGGGNGDQSQQALLNFPYTIDALDTGLVVVGERGTINSAPYIQNFCNYSLDHGRTWQSRIELGTYDSYAISVGVSPYGGAFFVAVATLMQINVYRFDKNQYGTTYSLAAQAAYPVNYVGNSIDIAVISDTEYVIAVPQYFHNPPLPGDFLVFGAVSANLTGSHAPSIDMWNGTWVCSTFTEEVLSYTPDIIRRNLYLYVNGILIRTIISMEYPPDVLVPKSTTVHTDRQGNWVVACSEEGTAKMLVSFDNAVTWSLYTLPDVGLYVGLIINSSTVYSYGKHPATPNGADRSTYTQVLMEHIVNSETGIVTSSNITPESMGKSVPNDINLHNIALFRRSS